MERASVSTPLDLRGVLRSKYHQDFSLELYHLTPRTAPRMRRASPYLRTALLLKRQSRVNVAELLDVSSDEAVRILHGTPAVQRLLKKGLVEVL